ncbi:hypothetical protein [Saezia sanguinis]|uniref:hypothetical protein n=1 Tax=Saezia sanguinis TaxID=1965230 RepID=UPI003063B051
MAFKKIRVGLLGLLGLFLFPQMLYAANRTPFVPHTLYFSAQNALCIASVNQVQIIENYYDEGPLAAGLNITPYLENGANTIAVDVASLTALKGDPTYPADFECRIVIKAALPEGDTEVIQLVATVAQVDGELQPTGAQSPHYQGSASAGAVTEFEKEGTILYHIEREVTLSGLPEWAWTKATVFEDTPENMEKLRQAYEELWQLMNHQDMAGIQEKARISFEEKEAANHLAPGMWADSLGFDAKFEQSTGAVPIRWDDFELETAMGGRLVRLDNRGFSPLRLKNQEGKGFWGYNPWFSLIDGELVISR